MRRGWTTMARSSVVRRSVANAMSPPALQARAVLSRLSTLRSSRSVRRSHTCKFVEVSRTYLPKVKVQSQVLQQQNAVGIGCASPEA